MHTGQGQDHNHCMYTGQGQYHQYHTVRAHAAGLVPPIPHSACTRSGASTASTTLCVHTQRGQCHTSGLLVRLRVDHPSPCLFADLATKHGRHGRLHICHLGKHVRGLHWLRWPRVLLKTGDRTVIRRNNELGRGVSKEHVSASTSAKAMRQQGMYRQALAAEAKCARAYTHTHLFQHDKIA
eukprot:scaffold9331_cov19-Tisochrysis_lutea.AAC.6